MTEERWQGEERLGRVMRALTCEERLGRSSGDERKVAG
jgi:hypothetical protein